MEKGNSIITHVVADAGITFTVKDAGSFVFDYMLAVGSAELVNALGGVGRQALIHGFVQKISDRAAIGRDPDTGKSASPQEKFEAMKECADRLMSGGPWNTVREGGTGNEGGLLYRAMKRLYPNDANTVSRKAFGEWLEAKAAEETVARKEKITVADVRRGLLAVKSIAKEVEKIRAEDGSGAKIDGSAMLADLK